MDIIIIIVSRQSRGYHHHYCFSPITWISPSLLFLANHVDITIITVSRQSRGYHHHYCFSPITWISSSSLFLANHVDIIITTVSHHQYCFSPITWTPVHITANASSCLLHKVIRRLCPCSLGAHHDGVGNSCSASDMFLMTATLDQITTSNRANAFTFSPCTLQSFKDLLSGVTDQ